MLDEIERGRYAGYRREIDKLRFLTGRALIRAAAAERLSVEPEAVELDSSCFDCGKPHGKPTVVGSTLEVSISHSGDRVGLAVTTGVPVGIDVEEVRAAEVDDLAGIAFSPAELTTFRAVPEAERRGAFFTYWSRKEAVLKATGKGMSLGMTKVTLTGHDEPPRVVAADTPEVDVPNSHMVDLDAGADYRACVAVFATEAPQVIEHDGNELLAKLG
jgi:4'-phosphopantetheinyl transferase